MKTTLLIFMSLGVIMVSCTFFPSKYGSDTLKQSLQYEDGKFHNSKRFETMSFSQIPGYIKRYLTEKRTDITPKEAIPLQKITRELLVGLPEDRLTLFRLGHSSFLIKISTEYWLIDPVFSERASPFSFIGPKRFHQPPISIADLPDIRGVIISHNHYDHLDKYAVKELMNKVDTFIVPLAVGSELKEWGIAEDKIVELDWWHSIKVGELTLTSTPAQHFSGRGITDSNKTLWSSWVIKSEQQSLFYSGDSGYFEGFKQIGKLHGPFDMTIIETGAYDKDWPDVHMTPEESLQAHLDVGGKKMLPAHNGTFDLAFHAWYEPLERISQLGQQARVDVITPIIGEPVDITSNASKLPWWRNLN